MSVHPHRSRPDRGFGMLSPITAIVFSIVCWLVFSRLFDTHDVAALPVLTRRFLIVQPWWLAAGLLGLALGLAAHFSGAESIWAKRSRAWSIALGAFSVLNIGWGIIAMYQLLLPPAAI
ncbi:MAG: hypothetical protein IPH43_09275 [Xanthomonadales bacterium]|nr:hypothetical protein [Xanthomonadales bacterium]